MPISAETRELSPQLTTPQVSEQPITHPIELIPAMTNDRLLYDMALFDYDSPEARGPAIQILDRLIAGGATDNPLHEFTTRWPGELYTLLPHKFAMTLARSLEKTGAMLGLKIESVVNDAEEIFSSVSENQQSFVPQDEDLNAHLDAIQLSEQMQQLREHPDTNQPRYRLYISFKRHEPDQAEFLDFQVFAQKLDN